MTHVAVSLVGFKFVQYMDRVKEKLKEKSEKRIKPDQTDPARSSHGLFPSLISSLILIYIYESLLCSLIF